MDPFKDDLLFSLSILHDPYRWHQNRSDPFFQQSSEQTNVITIYLSSTYTSLVLNCIKKHLLPKLLKIIRRKTFQNFPKWFNFHGH